MKLDRKYVSFYYDQVEDLPDYKIDSKEIMLLLIDLQNEFYHLGGRGAREFKATGVWDQWKLYFDYVENTTIPNAKELLDFFRASNLPVSFGRIACLRENGEDRSPVQKPEDWSNMLISVDSRAAQMVNELVPIKNEVVVNKTADPVMTGTNYLQLLRYMGIITVVVGGIVADQCVASTVRGLADEGLRVLTVEDAYASADMALHDAELKVMNVVYTHVVKTQEAIGLIQKKL